MTVTWPKSGWSRSACTREDRALPEEPIQACGHLEVVRIMFSMAPQALLSFPARDGALRGKGLPP